MPSIYPKSVILAKLLDELIRGSISPRFDVRRASLDSPCLYQFVFHTSAADVENALQPVYPTHPNRFLHFITTLHFRRQYYC
jgi:hypothetical protein